MRRSKCGSKQGMFPTKGERCSPEGKVYSKRVKMTTGSSQHMREEYQIGGGTKGDHGHGFRGRPSHHWMMVSIQASVSG